MLVRLDLGPMSMVSQQVGFSRLYKPIRRLQAMLDAEGGWHLPDPIPDLPSAGAVDDLVQLKQLIMEPLAVLERQFTIGWSSFHTDGYDNGEYYDWVGGPDAPYLGDRKRRRFYLNEEAFEGLVAFRIWERK
jgi:hypothetical protein